MSWLKTGDVVQAFSVIWPFITREMIRDEADDPSTALEAMQFREGGGYFYNPESIQTYLNKRHDVHPTKKEEALRMLGLNFRQVRLELLRA
jgi:hypothetical protein